MQINRRKSLLTRQSPDSIPISTLKNDTSNASVQLGSMVRGVSFGALARYDLTLIYYLRIYVCVGVCVSVGGCDFTRDLS